MCSVQRLYPMSGMTKCKDENIKVEIAETKFITPKTKLAKVPKFGKKHATSRTATVAVLEAFFKASRTATVAVRESRTTTCCGSGSIKKRFQNCNMLRFWNFDDFW